jgi:hypothetical protein
VQSKYLSRHLKAIVMYGDLKGRRAKEIGIAIDRLHTPSF